MGNTCQTASKEDAKEVAPIEEVAPIPALALNERAPVQAVEAGPVNGEKEPVHEVEAVQADAAAPESVREAKVEAAIDAEKAYEASFKIEFDCGGETKAITFKKAPLGFTFPNQMPLTVDTLKPQQQAEELGVQKGWVLKTLGNKQTEGLEFPEAVDIMKQEVAKLPKA